jgi:HAD superfamily hydrolase (TIGR01490 family)
MKRPVAFFDIDGTLFRSSLLIELVEEFIVRGIFPKSASEGFAQARYAWLDRVGSYEDYISAVVETFRTHIQGVHYGSLADIGKEVAALHGRRVYRYTRDLIHSLKEEGYFLVAISQSPKTILDDFCGAYGFDKVYGRVYEIGAQDKFTGTVIDEHLIANKANIVRRVAEKNEVDMSTSIGVGDTEGDIPLLEAVAEPICFNPNEALYTHAKRVGWKVVVERKDVIYPL